jgi:hypothetical protein
MRNLATAFLAGCAIIAVSAAEPPNAYLDQNGQLAGDVTVKDSHGGQAKLGESWKVTSSGQCHGSEKLGENYGFGREGDRLLTVRAGGLLAGGVDGGSQTLAAAGARKGRLRCRRKFLRRAHGCLAGPRHRAAAHGDARLGWQPSRLPQEDPACLPGESDRPACCWPAAHPQGWRTRHRSPQFSAIRESSLQHAEIHTAIIWDNVRSEFGSAHLSACLHLRIVVS